MILPLLHPYEPMTDSARSLANRWMSTHLRIGGGWRRLGIVACVIASLCTLPGIALATQAEASTADETDPPKSREELLRRLRLERAQGPLEPRYAGLIERNLLALEKAERPSVLDFNVWGVFPRIYSISRGSAPGPGFRLWKPNIGGSRMDVHASAFMTSRGYRFYDAQFGILPHRTGRMPTRTTRGIELYRMGDLNRGGLPGLTLYAGFRYMWLPQEDFYGLGPDTSADGHSGYLEKSVRYSLVGGYQFSPRVALVGSAGLLQTFIGRGRDENVTAAQDLYDDEDAPGLDRQPDMLQVKAQLLVDGRDEVGNPHHGGFLAIELSRYDDLDFGEFAFWRFGIDARAYLQLGAAQRILALRGFFQLDDADPGNRVPFYLQESFGGSHTFRGFSSFRFRGEKALLFQVEYRWEASPALELVLFADAGSVGRTDEPWNADDLEFDWGTGVRLKSWKDVLLRLDWGHSNETSRILFRFSNSY